ncbi:hypothetical protein DEO72_LG7g3267 [Vigna unguiculata]|uniref:Uncharacterized protein n=1 Tax=Vigna unguiculata TaxID=3917 RepID=A0A4D6MKE9_VIGUN|nr:hypothetical protein DEO72_LG7g3266 [Vigna unguiculata]QCE01966.1 hypothetical protein DEO72_LG7g3267 [Vigna unguiculata]
MFFLFPSRNTQCKIQSLPEIEIVSDTLQTPNSASSTNRRQQCILHPLKPTAAPPSPKPTVPPPPSKPTTCLPPSKPAVIVGSMDFQNVLHEGSSKVASNLINMEDEEYFHI